MRLHAIVLLHIDHNSGSGMLYVKLDDVDTRYDRVAVLFGHRGDDQRGYGEREKEG